ncbi:CCA tRNA nucleotidyltransferase [Paenibacillus sp. GXUN7292]|uniref:CCA tRNA nucleotidyltransferase n=1 Tax=Paenibacillus sp. GXUN7292 TaxID=3422499 RepID=UPI003D7CF671
MELPQMMVKALPIVRRLEEAGHSCVFVGGAVRDTLLGLPIADIDLATSALPEQTMALFEQVIPTGLQHGTVTVVWDKQTYEITTFREDSSYEKHRKPQSVHYVSSLLADLKRRDFTMNAMAFYADGKLADPFNGRQHLARSMLYSVGSAEERFEEDALRMLRGVRFIAVYELAPAISMWRAIKSRRSLMKHIAMERVQAELDKLLQASNPYRGLRWLIASELLLHVKVPLAKEVDFRLCIMSSKLDKLRSLHRLDKLDLRWAAFFIAALNLSAAEHWLEQLRFSNSRKSQIMLILRLHASAVEIKNKEGEISSHEWAAIIIEYGKQTVYYWLHITEALLNHSQLPFALAELKQLKDHADLIPLSTLKELAITGKDLQQIMNKPAGPWVKQLLQKLLLSAALGEVSNNYDQLAKHALAWKNEVE